MSEKLEKNINMSEKNTNESERVGTAGQFENKPRSKKPYNKVWTNTENAFRGLSSEMMGHVFHVHSEQKKKGQFEKQCKH